MKLQAVAKTLVAGAAAILIAGCGGGGGSASTPTPPASLALSGTAATGLALANAAVTVKCASGDGTATTTTAGAYSVSISGGALPCMIRVSGTTGAGIAVTLHSVADSGSTAASGDTSAVANVTPVTEMIVAQLTASLPGDAFANFNPQSVTQATVTAAATAIVNALKTAGIDLSGVDPLKATLVPATSTTAGNAYDVLLDLLGDSVGPEALPLVVNQIANAATTNSSAGLTTAISAVAGGTLEGCPYAVSGKYRTVEFRGATALHTVDFKAMTLTTEGHAETIVKSSTNACQFSVGPTTIVVSPSGAGVFQSPEDAGYFFPVQSHALSSIAGQWNFLESGMNESNVGDHFFGKFTINADGSASVCDYDVMHGVANFSTCTPETETVSVAAASDGTFTLNYGADVAKIFGYRTPAGTLHLFGTGNPEADYSSTAHRTHFLMNRPGALTLPALDSVSKYWDMLVTTFPDGAVSITGLATGEVKVTAVDAATDTFHRTRASDGRVDSFRINHPVEGLRFRPASTGVSSLFMFMMPGLGISPFIDNQPTGHFYGMAVQRP